ncbi:MAG: hypothetical protein Q9222_006002 [Ikaeria aurantiellina]
MAEEASAKGFALPPEILLHVIQYADTRTQRVIRLVCKAFAEAAIPYVFEELVVRSDMRCKEYASRLPFPFGRYVKKLCMVIAHYDFHPNDFQCITRCKCILAHIVYDSRHGDRALETLNRLQNDQKSAIAEGKCLSWLNQLLSQMPELSKVTLTDGVMRPSLGSNAKCDIPGCTYSDDDHQAYNIESDYGLGEYGAETWRVLMHALWIRRAQITDLIVQTRNCHPRGLYWCLYKGLCKGVFDRMLSKTVETVDIVKSLTRFHLHLHMRSVGAFGTHPEHSIAGVLRQVTQLKVLSISIDPEGAQNDLTAVLDGCKFPNLQVCILEGFSSTVKEILQFVLGCKRLTHLYLFFHNLNPAAFYVWETKAHLWNQLAKDLRERSPTLKSIQRDHVDGHLQAMSEHSDAKPGNQLESLWLRPGYGPPSDGLVGRIVVRETSFRRFLQF